MKGKWVELGKVHPRDKIGLGWPTDISVNDHQHQHHHRDIGLKETKQKDKKYVSK